MTLSDREINELFNDFSACAARYGGVVSRATFDHVIAFARVREPAAIKALTRIYQFVSSELVREKRGHGNGNEGQQVKV